MARSRDSWPDLQPFFKSSSFNSDKDRGVNWKFGRRENRAIGADFDRMASRVGWAKRSVPTL